MADDRRWPLVWSPLSPEEMKAKGEWPPKTGTVYGAPWLLRPTNIFCGDLPSAGVTR